MEDFSTVKVKSLGDGKFVVYFSGRVDVSKSSDIENDLERLIASEKVTSMIVSLGAVEYLSSSGFRVLIAIMRKLKSNDATLKLCDLTSDIQRMFDVIEMTSLFNIFETETAAIQAK